MSETESDTLLPQNKRQRRIDNGDQRTRSPYWFEDGNIILKAENTLFRVHQSILSRYSQILKDTFAVPSHGKEHIEGCPVIPLSDTAKDWGNIIFLLYHNDKTLTFGNKLPPSVLGSMLRLGRKYLIAHLENDALARLHHDHPKKLEDWDSLSNDSRQIEDILLESVPTKEIISIAHEFKLFTILPAAYARYHRWQNPKFLLKDNGIPETARKHCIIGSSRILTYLKDKMADALCPPFALPSKTCSTGGKCGANKWDVIKNMSVWDTNESAEFGIYSCTKAMVTENLCPRCQAAVIKLSEEVRLEFWLMLPTFFNLPAWADLKDEP